MATLQGGGSPVASSGREGLLCQAPTVSTVACGAVEAARKERTMATHKHRAVRTVTRGWTLCVAKGGACNGAPHGNVVHVDTCACGAEKRTEANGRHVATSGWVSPASSVQS